MPLRTEKALQYTTEFDDELVYVRLHCSAKSACVASDCTSDFYFFLFSLAAVDLRQS